MILLKLKEINTNFQQIKQENEGLQIGLSGKLKLLDKKKQTLKLLMKLFENLNRVLHFFIEQKLTVSKDPTILDNISLYLSILLLTIFKHPSKYRLSMLLSLTKTIDFNIDPTKLSLYDILQHQNFLYEKLEYGIPLNKLFIEGLSVIEFLIDTNIFFCNIIDPSGFSRKFLFERYKKTIFFESWTINKETIKNIEKCVSGGLFLIIEEPDSELLKAIAPLVDWKAKEINREVAELLAKREILSREKREIQEKTVFLEGKSEPLAVNPKFRLCIISKNANKAFSCNDIRNRVDFFFVFIQYYWFFSLDYYY